MKCNPDSKLYNGLLSPKAFSLLILAILFLASCNQKPKTAADNISSAISTSKGYTDTATSSVKVFDQNGKVCIQQSNTYYETVNWTGANGKTSILLKIKKTELCFADSVNKDKVFEITARSVSPGKNISWQTSFVATDISFADNTLLTVKEGDDSEHEFFRRFSLENGSEVFSCSFSDLEVKIPNVANKYFIGYTSKRAASDPLGQLKQENLLGVVRFGSSSASIDSFTVKLKRSKVADKIRDAVPGLLMVSGNENAMVIEDGRTIALIKLGTNYTDKDIDGFGAKFTYYYGDDNESTDIFIPVVNGRFDMSHAKYDKDIFEIGGF